MVAYLRQTVNENKHIHGVGRAVLHRQGIAELFCLIPQHDIIRFPRTCCCIIRVPHLGNLLGRASHIAVGGSNWCTVAHTGHRSVAEGCNQRHNVALVCSAVPDLSHRRDKAGIDELLVFQNTGRVVC